MINQCKDCEFKSVIERYSKKYGCNKFVKEDGYCFNYKKKEVKE